MNFRPNKHEYYGHFKNYVDLCRNMQTYVELAWSVRKNLVKWDESISRICFFILSIFFTYFACEIKTFHFPFSTFSVPNANPKIIITYYLEDTSLVFSKQTIIPYKRIWLGNYQEKRAYISLFFMIIFLIISPFGQIEKLIKFSLK